MSSKRASGIPSYQSSAFLRLAAALSDDWWAECMQPHLEAAGATSSLASTCKQLQRLCQGSVTQLRLPADDLAELQTIASAARHGL
jgi:hypothetical protein